MTRTNSLAAVLHSNGFAYFFRNQHYFKFDLQAGRVVKISVLDQHYWTGVSETIDAALVHNDTAYLFFGHEFFKYSLESDKVVARDRIDRDGWYGIRSEIGSNVQSSSD